MANTFTQFYVHIVFAPKNRDALVKNELKDKLEKYITGIVQKHEHKILAIKCMPDHVHIFIGYNVNQLIPVLIGEIKTSSCAWIKYNKLTKYKFEWQKGYGAFTYSKSSVQNVINYIHNQEQHHQKKSFKEEYLRLLRKQEISYQVEYLFDFFE
jgi:putative transposase